MAEGFARAYGTDVLIPQSAGLAPSLSIAPLTHKVMLEKNIHLDAAFPKPFDTTLLRDCDLIVNMSGYKLPLDVAMQVEEWTVLDPIGESEDVYREVANHIEHLVMQLILKLRAQRPHRNPRRAG